MKEYSCKKVMRKVMAVVIAFAMVVQSSLIPDIAYAADDVQMEINGFQISTQVEAFRTIYSVADSAAQTEEIGLVYGLADMAADGDMIVGSTNNTVHSYAATPIGKIDDKYSSLDNAQSYCLTMKFVKAAEFYRKGIKVRAYAKFKNGSYVYSDISEVSVYDIADTLYQQKLMANENRHDYLYNNVLSVVNPSYGQVEYRK